MIANREFLVYDLFYILASQSTSYLVGAASSIFSEMAGCRAFGLYMLRFAQDNRHQVKLLNERNTRERVEPFLTGETFYEIFNMMYDVQSQLMSSFQDGMIYLHIGHDGARSSLICGPILIRSLKLAFSSIGLFYRKANRFESVHRYRKHCEFSRPTNWTY
jgi:hypothetical protein